MAILKTMLAAPNFFPLKKKATGGDLPCIDNPQLSSQPQLVLGRGKRGPFEPTCIFITLVHTRCPFQAAKLVLLFQPYSWTLVEDISAACTICPTKKAQDQMFPLTQDSHKATYLNQFYFDLGNSVIPFSFCGETSS